MLNLLNYIQPSKKIKFDNQKYQSSSEIKFRVYGDAFFNGSPRNNYAVALKIPGKIVGVTNAVKDHEGKLFVEEIFVS